jgi:hypothetical protein
MAWGCLDRDRNTDSGNHCPHFLNLTGCNQLVHPLLRHRSPIIHNIDTCRPSYDVSTGKRYPEHTFVCQVTKQILVRAKLYSVAISFFGSVGRFAIHPRDYCSNAGGGPLIRFQFKLTLTSTRFAILINGMPLFMP